MGWNVQQPYVASTGAEVRVSIIKIKSGNPRCQIGLSRDLLKALGNPTACDVFVGDGEEAGQLMLQFGGEGEHELKRHKLGGGVAEAWPSREHAAIQAACGRREVRARCCGRRYRATDDLAALVA